MVGSIPKEGRRGRIGHTARFRLLQAQILPSRETFNPIVYLSRIHLVRLWQAVAGMRFHTISHKLTLLDHVYMQTSGVAKLQQGKVLIRNHIDRQTVSVQRLVKEHFGRIAGCQKTIANAAAYMLKTEMSRREHVSTQSTLQHVSQAGYQPPCYC